MDFQIALLLVQDGIVNGAIYGLMGLALVLVFSVTRVIFIPQGELVAFAALSMAALNGGRAPRTLWLLLGLAVVTLLVEAWRHRRGAAVDWPATLVWTVLLPLLAGALVLLRPASLALQALTTLLVVAPLGPLLYRLAYRPLADATRADAADRVGRPAWCAGRAWACCSSAPRVRARRHFPIFAWTWAACR